jgi:hypothetical protein
MTAIDTSANVRAAARTAIEKQSFGEDFGFDCAPSAVQTPAGIAVFYTLVITKKHPLLGHGPLANITRIPAAEPTAEQVEEVVADAIRQLRELSAQIMAKKPALGPVPRLKRPRQN